MPLINDAVSYTADGNTAAEFRRLSNGYTNAQTGTSYTLVAADNGVTITCSNASAITVTIPSGLGANFCCRIVQLGAGQVSVAPGSGVTLNSYQSQRKVLGQFTSVDLWAYAANTFLLEGATTT